VDLVDAPAETPVWLSLSRQNKGTAISGQAIANIFYKHLGTSKVHTLRHTFVHTMERSGAPVSEIQVAPIERKFLTPGCVSVKRWIYTLVMSFSNLVTKPCAQGNQEWCRAQRDP